MDLAKSHGEADTDFEISADRSRVDPAAVQEFLSRSYWAAGIPLEVVRRSIENSLCFGVYRGERMVGFARVITDRATFAYLSDVFIDEPFRGLGLSKRLVRFILDHADLQGLRRWVLATTDAHELYRAFGFTSLRAPDTYMEKLVPDAYRKHHAG